MLVFPGSAQPIAAGAGCGAMDAAPRNGALRLGRMIRGGNQTIILAPADELPLRAIRGLATGVEPRHERSAFCDPLGGHGRRMVTLCDEPERWQGPKQGEAALRNSGVQAPRPRRSPDRCGSVAGRPGSGRSFALRTAQSRWRAGARRRPLPASAGNRRAAKASRQAGFRWDMRAGCRCRAQPGGEAPGRGPQSLTGRERGYARARAAFLPGRRR